MKTEEEIRQLIYVLELKKKRSMRKIGGYDTNAWYRIKKEYEAKIEQLKWVLNEE